MTVAAGPGRPDCAGRPGRQSGQAIVLVALAMVAMLAMTAVVLSAGQLYWARRSAQQLADSGALAAAAMIPCSGQNAYAALDGVISTQLGVSPSLSQTPAACGTSPSTWSRTYPNGTGVAATYPYVDTTRVQVVVTLPAWLVLGGLLGVGQASVSARAVAQNSGASPPRNYALYAQDGIKCGGTAVFDLKGSIYSGGPIDGNCTIYSHAIPNDDPGNILVYPANQQWNQGGGACVSGTATGNVVCADGYEISQSQCPPAGSTDFFGSLRVDYPCPTWTVQAPSYAPYSSPDPNADARAQATIGGAACDPGGGAATYLPLLIGTTAVGRMKPGLAVVGGLTVPNTPYKDGGGYYHFRPGCYGWLDVSLVRSGDSGAQATVVFDPGFYLFSGFHQSSDKKGSQGAQSAGGLCLNDGTRAVGRDVLFEFTSALSPSSFSTSSCDDLPTSSTGTSSPCDPSANPFCPLPSGSSWCPKTDRACNATLVWAPPGPPVTTLAAIVGTFFAQGPAEQSWLYGTIFWPGSAGPGQAGCQWTSNGGSSIVGSLICQSVLLQGGSSSTGSGITYARTDTNSAPSQAGLTE